MRIIKHFPTSGHLQMTLYPFYLETHGLSLLTTSNQLILPSICLNLHSRAGFFDVRAPALVPTCASPHAHASPFFPSASPR